MRPLILLLSLFMCSIANAELRLEINGPDKGLTGDLVVLDCIGSEATLKAWIVPEQLSGKTIEGCGDQIAFATRTEGVYTFYLYGTDGTALLHTKHTVTVTKNVGPIDPDPVDPDPVDPVDPPPVGNFDSLMKSSKELSLSLDDSKVRAKLAERLDKPSFGDDIATAQTNVETIFTKVLAERTRDEQDANWFDGWYVPILKQIKQFAEVGAIRTVEQYNAAIKAVVVGLKS